MSVAKANSKSKIGSKIKIGSIVPAPKDNAAIVPVPAPNDNAAIVPAPKAKAAADPTKIRGKLYLKSISSENILYDIVTCERIGIWDPITECIDYDYDDYEDDEYDRYDCYDIYLSLNYTTYGVLEKFIGSTLVDEVKDYSSK